VLLDAKVIEAIGGIVDNGQQAKTHRNAVQQLEPSSHVESNLDEQVEAAAASHPVVTFTLSIVLFACQFCSQ